jgi:hypothetical protein
MTHVVSSAQVLTYHTDIKPLIDRHCLSCHQPGDVGAMPLTHYEEVSAYGKMIEYVTTSRLMPPWYADTTYSHFSNQRVLSSEEIQKIRDWVLNGMPEGISIVHDSSLHTPVPIFQREPDLVVSMAEAFEQYGIYYDQYQVFVWPTHLDEDAWIEGIEFVAGNKNIVRHASISVESSDKFDSLDRWDPRYGYYSFGGMGKTPEEPFWYTWSPQQKMTHFPESSAKLLPKGSNLIVHIHYGPTGRPQLDSSSIRLFFAQKKPLHQILTAPLINPYTLTGDSLYILPSTKKIFHASYTVPYDIEVMSLTPQANLICRSWEVFAKLPGKTEPLKLLKINDWNFNWKQTYHFGSPVSLPAGTVIHALAHYDNTTDNPCNPSDKPILITWGAHLFNELFFVHVEHWKRVPNEGKIGVNVPSVLSDKGLSGTLEAAITYFAEIRIVSSLTGEYWVLDKRKFKRGTHGFNYDTSSIPYGNYVLQIVNKKGTVVAQQLLVNMWYKGM